jgi:hypothetical protein
MIFGKGTHSNRTSVTSINCSLLFWTISWQAITYRAGSGVVVTNCYVNGHMNVVRIAQGKIFMNSLIQEALLATKHVHHAGIIRRKDGSIRAKSANFVV